MSNRTDIMLAVLETLKLCGVSACELTYAKASERFGAWFVQAARRGDLRPVRTGKRTSWYAIADILAYEDSQRQVARIQLDTIKNTRI